MSERNFRLIYKGSDYDDLGDDMSLTPIKFSDGITIISDQEIPGLSKVENSDSAVALLRTLVEIQKLPEL